MPSLVRKKVTVPCRQCGVSVQKYSQDIKSWSGKCKQCLSKWRSGRKVFYRHCVDCGKESRYIGKSSKCWNCYTPPSGSNHYKWKKDRTTLSTSRSQAYDRRYKEWMHQVKNRDSWKCKISNNDCRGRLEAHHILSWSEHPELRYEVNNGIALCKFHHPRKREEEKMLAQTFREMILRPTLVLADNK